MYVCICNGSVFKAFDFVEESTTGMYSLQSAAVPRPLVSLIKNLLYVTDDGTDRQMANLNQMPVQLLNPSEHLYTMPDEHGDIVYKNFEVVNNSENPDSLKCSNLSEHLYTMPDELGDTAYVLRIYIIYTYIHIYIYIIYIYICLCILTVTFLEAFDFIDESTAGVYSLQSAAIPRQLVSLVNNPLYVADAGKDPAVPTEGRLPLASAVATTVRPKLLFLD